MMNILRGEIEVELGGRKRLVKFGLNQMAIYTQKHRIDLSEMTTIGVAEIRDLIWSGLVAGAKKNGEEIDFDEWQVGDWLEEMEQTEYDAVMQTFQKAMPSGDGDAKKK